MEDDDVPDLDDMTELVQGIKQNQKKQSQPTANAVKKSAPIFKTLEDKHASELQVENTAVKPKQFGGMKKGFLFGGKSKATKKNLPREKTEIVTPKVPTKNEDKSLVFDEVQEAMKGMPGMDKSWITQDLLQQVGSSEKLSKQLADPRIAEAITLMQKDPKKAMEYYKNDQEIQTFFKEFYMILGNHFTKLGDQQIPSNSSSSPEDDKAMEAILSNPEIKEILMKPDIQKLIELLRNNPDEAQKHLNASNPSFRSDVNKLVSAGVLGFQQS